MCGSIPQVVFNRHDFIAYVVDFLKVRFSHGRVTHQVVHLGAHPYLKGIEQIIECFVSVVRGQIDGHILCLLHLVADEFVE